MPLLPWGEYKPDVSDYEGSATKNILNVVPRGDGYGPFKAFAAATQALPSACRGAFYALKTDGTVQVFAGTSKMLYRLNNTDLSWIPISRLANCTISNNSPGVVTYTNTFVANEPVVFAAGAGTLPAQIVAGTVYYVHATGLSGSSFSVSATPGGTRINTSGGSGTVKITGQYTALSSNANWSFAQFGLFVFATQANEPMQKYDFGTPTQAIDNPGSTAIQAAYVSVVGRFLVLSGLLLYPFRIQWSGLEDTTQWNSGTNSSDFQNFADGGTVRGVAGGEFGTIFQDQAIRRMSFIPGSALIFQIERITQDMGLFAPGSIITSGSTIYFYSGKGFYKLDAGGFPTQLGRERVDRTFFNDLDRGNLQLLQGAADPRGSLVYWAYKSGSGPTGLFDKLLGYDTALDRFFQIAVNGEYLLGISQAGITLEGLDVLTGVSLSVSGAANNGSGLIRIATSSTTGLTTGQILTISGVTGTTEANGTWTITVIDATHFDLQGSTFANAYSSGGLIGATMETLALTFDAYANSVQPQIAAFDSNHKQGFFTGSNLEATMESSEQGTDGQRIEINGFRPVTDAATFYGSCSSRETQQAVAMAGTEALINSRTGSVDLRKSTRYSRMKGRIPAGTTWTYCAGIEPDVSLDGET